MNKVLKTVLLIILLVGLISTVSYCSAPFDTETARIISMRQSIDANGYVLRKETVIQNETNGIFEPGIKDGVRVARASTVGVVISGNLDKQLASELESVNRRIEEIRQSDSIADIYSSDEARIFSAMRDMTASIRESVREGDYLSAEESTRQLSVLLQKKYSAENTAAADKLLVSLEEQKYNLEQQLGGIREEVLAPRSGYFYSTLDGLENVGSEEDIALLSNSAINKFSKTLEDYTRDSSQVGKICDTYTWYFAASVPLSEAQKLEVGDSVTISVDESPFVKATVLAVNKDTTDMAAVILKSNRNISGIYEKRVFAAEICIEEYSGLYVPSAAIRVRDDVTGVYVMNKNNSISFRCVNILAEEDDYYIAENKYEPPEGSGLTALKVYDNILVNPEVTDIDE